MEKLEVTNCHYKSRGVDDWKNALLVEGLIVYVDALFVHYLYVHMIENEMQKKLTLIQIQQDSIDDSHAVESRSCYWRLKSS